MNDLAGRSGGVTGTVIIALMLIGVGVVTLFDTAGYTDIDSVVFPRAAAIMLIVTSSLVALVALLRGDDSPGFGAGLWWRRLLLVGAMLVAVLLMPWVSFLPAAALAFAGALLAAMHERWQWRRALLYGVSAVVILLGFYALFRFVLQVPLP